MKVEGHEIKISNPGKVLFPESGIKKKELITYYERISHYMLPYLQGRPVSMQRYPDGIDKESFFQKEIPHYFPDFIGRVQVKEAGREQKYYAMINNAASLVYIANHASIPIHTWQSREDKLNYPDQVLWDLDPPGNDDFERVRIGARLLKYMLEELGLRPYIKTTGSKGLHLAVPLEPKWTYTAVKAFSRQVAEFISARLPELFTAEIRRNKRHGRIFVDFLRNGYGHTAVAPYAVRPIEGAPVAAPIHWEELEDDAFHPQIFTIRNIHKRLEKTGDIWKGFYADVQDMDAAQKKLDAIMQKAKKKQIASLNKKESASKKRA